MPGMSTVLSNISKAKTKPSRCANAACSKSALAQSLLWRRPGLLVEEQWCCSPACCEVLAAKRIADLVSLAKQAAGPRPKRMPLGLLLMSRSILNAEQLKLALEEQRVRGTNFGEAAQSLGFVSAEQITSAVAAQWGCPVFTIKDRRLPEVRIPLVLSQFYGMLPVHCVESGNKVCIACVDTVHHPILCTVEHMTGWTTMPCFITGSEYQELLRELMAAPRENEITFEEGRSASEITGMIREHLSKISAQMVRIGICRDYLWARLANEERELDLMFRFSMV
jgi:hypothetical protein